MLTCQWADEQWQLLAERAAFWPRTQTLVLADPHFGKAATFRRAGIPVPAGSTARNLETLDRALEQTQARRLVIVGDLFHARPAAEDGTLEQIGAWRMRHATVEVVLVTGNHDKHAGAPPTDWGFELVGERWSAGGIDFCHLPDDATPGRATVAGHVHPVVTLRDPTVGRLRLPCFHLTADRLTLPAFGVFTGGHAIGAQEAGRIFACGEGAVLEIPRRALFSSR